MLRQLAARSRASWQSAKQCAAAFHAIPSIDISPLVQQLQVHVATHHPAVQQVAKQLHAACTDVGFFYISGHGVPAQVQEDVLKQARAWFQLPEHVKSQIEIQPETNYRGYQRLGANVTRYDGGFARDFHEAIDLYREVDARQLQIAASPIHGHNQWPVQLPAFDDALRGYIQSMLGLGAVLMEGIALALGLPRQYFAGQRAGQAASYWCARVIHYPPLTQGDAHSVQLSCGEHADYGLLTFVNQEDHVAALQVKNAEGHWITAYPVPGTFVCNLGDMLKVWSNGLYQPTMHRVINADPTQSRVSLPFFYEPCYDALVEPPMELLQRLRMQPREQSVLYGRHLESKVLRNFEL
eukprot:jgi/Astpho2/3840/e_gw1.00062.83.1_t